MLLTKCVLLMCTTMYCSKITGTAYMNLKISQGRYNGALR